MPQGYIFLGSGDKNHDERYTLDHFVLDTSDESIKIKIPELYKLCLKVINNSPENISEEDQEKIGYNYREGKLESKKITWAIAHCNLCRKYFHRLNNAVFYCWPCEYCCERLKKEEKEKSTN